MESKRFIPLKFTIMLSILLIIVPLFITLSLIDYFSSSAELRENYKMMQIQTESNIENALKLVDNGYKMLETSLDDRMKKAFTPFINAYKKADNADEIDLEQLKEDIGNKFDLYMVNEDGVITHTTNERDLGLDFKQWPDFYKRLTDIRTGDEFTSDRMVPSIKDGVLTKWAYMPSPDHKYVLELGLSSNEFDEYLKKFDPLKITEELKTFNPSIISIKLFDKNYRIQGEIDTKAEEPIQKIVDKLWENENDVIEIKDGNSIKRYTYIKRVDEKFASDLSRVMGIVYDTTSIEQSLFNKTLYHLLIGIAGIALGILAAFFVSSRVSKPILQIVTDVNLVAKGDLDHQIKINPRNELKVLKNSINSMVIKIKDYNEHLEDMVKQRTEELNLANEELRTINKAMMEELRMAQRVQQSIIPKTTNLPHSERLNYASNYSSMEKIGGDLFDIIRVGRNGIGLLMADVSGHGVPAALITTMAKVTFNSNSIWGLDTGEICKRINDELFEFIGDLEYYLTAYYGIIDLESGIFKYTNAGHHPAVIYRPIKSEIIELDTDGFFIGAFEGVEYETKYLRLEEGDRILMFTDGITEARNKNKKFYGEERLLDFVKNNSKLPPKDFVDTLMKEVDDFCEGELPTDDRAVLYVEFKKKVSDNTPLEEAINIEATHTALKNKEEETFEIEETENKNYRELYVKSTDYIKSGKFNEALKVLDKLLEMKPGNVNVMNNISICYYKLGRLKDASEILKKAIRLDKNNEKVKRNKEIIDKKLKNINK